MFEEFYKSEVANSLKIDNTPNRKQFENIARFYELIIDPLQKETGEKIEIIRGFECWSLITKTYGMKDTLSHASGCAADISLPNVPNIYLARNILFMNLAYDTLALEFTNSSKFGMVHVSITNKPKLKPQHLLRTFGVKYGKSFDFHLGYLHTKYLVKRNIPIEIVSKRSGLANSSIQNYLFS